MPKNKIAIILIILFSVFLITSCNKDYQEDNYEFTLNEEERNEYVKNIPLTSSKNYLTYLVKSADSCQIITYVFEKEVSVRKDIYTFYNNINNYWQALEIHDDFIDGYYNEVNQNILLIKNTHSDIDNISYEQLFARINESYQIIYSVEELIF